MSYVWPGDKQISITTLHHSKIQLLEIVIADLQEIMNAIRPKKNRSNMQPIAASRQFRYGAYHQPGVVKCVISNPISTVHILNLLRLINYPDLVW